jgi:ketosteroid isomerase-like protein
MKRSFATPMFLVLSQFFLVAAGVQAARAENTAITTVQEFTTAYNNKDIDKLVSLYASDAIMVSETGVAQGRDAIRARLSIGVQRGNRIDSLSPEKSEESGELSCTEGMAEVIGSGQRLQRHYLVVVKKVGSRSEIVIHYSLPNPGKTP